MSHADDGARTVEVKMATVKFPCCCSARTRHAGPLVLSVLHCFQTDDDLVGDSVSSARRLEVGECFDGKRA